MTGALTQRRNWQTGGMTLTDPVTAGAGPVAGEPCVLLKQGEIFLKGKNRQQFERILQANIRGAVRDTGVSAELLVREGVLVLRVGRDGLTAAEHAAAVDRVAARAAISSLGCVLFQALTETVPFPADHDLATLFAHGSPPPPSALPLPWGQYTRPRTTARGKAEASKQRLLVRNMAGFLSGG